MWKRITIHEVLLVLLLTYFDVNAQDVPTSEDINTVTTDLIGDGKACLNIDQLENVRNELKQRLDAAVEEILAHNVFQFQVSSCADIPSSYPAGYYWIKSNDSLSATRQYCVMNKTCGCSNESHWMRVANLNMIDPNEQCPPELKFKDIYGKRTCGRPASLSMKCASITYPVGGVKYSRVCGRMTGYQFGSPDAFNSYAEGGQTTIDQNYLDGVSITHGSSPRKHIWSFAAAVDEARFTSSVCPCNDPNHQFPGAIPPFVGQDYSCETGSRYIYENRYYLEDPLWDGKGCSETSTCCSFNTPPWFCKELPQPTTDDIEMRLCCDEGFSNEDVLLEAVEIYVQ